MTQAMSKGVLYLFPMSAGEEAFLPLEPLKFALTPSHAMEIQEGLRRFLNARRTLKVGLIASDDAFGRTVRQGVDNELPRHGRDLTAEVTFAPDETDFESLLEKLRAKGPELVVLGTQGEQALAVMRAAAAIRWHPLFLCSSACYAAEFATLAGDDGRRPVCHGPNAIPMRTIPKSGLGPPLSNEIRGALPRFRR